MAAPDFYASPTGNYDGTLGLGSIRNLSFVLNFEGPGAYCTISRAHLSELSAEIGFRRAHKLKNKRMQESQVNLEEIWNN